MSLTRNVCIAALAALAGVLGGVLGARRSTPPAMPVPTSAAVTIDCGELEALHRPLYELPTAPAPTPGFHPRPPSDFDVARADAERACVALPTCLVFPEGAWRDRTTPTSAFGGARFGVVLGASRLGGERSATIRIAGSADGLGVPPFASDAAVHEGEVVPTLAGPAQIVAIRAHDPDTYVVAKLLEGRRPGVVEPMRFFLGPAIGAVVADYMLSFSWERGVACVAVRHLETTGRVSVAPPIEENVTDTLTLGPHRYRVVGTQSPSGTSAGGIEVDARPDEL